MERKLRKLTVDANFDVTAVKPNASFKMEHQKSQLLYSFDSD